MIYNFMFPRSYGGERPGPASGETALLPLEEGPCPSCVAASRSARRRCGARRRSGSTSRSSRRRRCRGSSPGPTSVAGGTCASCPRPATATTATTSGRRRTDHRCRCSTCSTATARRSATSGAPSSPTRRGIPGRITAASAPSSRSGTCSTSGRGWIGGRVPPRAPPGRGGGGEGGGGRPRIYRTPPGSGWRSPSAGV